MFYLFLEGSLAAGFWVGFSIAAVAYFSSTFGAFTRFFLRVCTHNYRAFRVWTPFEVRILLYLQIAQKLPIFVISGQIDERPNKLVRERKLAMRTAEMLDPHASYLCLCKDTSSLR